MLMKTKLLKKLRQRFQWAWVAQVIVNPDLPEGSKWRITPGHWLVFDKKKIEEFKSSDRVYLRFGWIRDVSPTESAVFGMLNRLNISLESQTRKRKADRRKARLLVKWAIYRAIGVFK